MNRNRRQRSRSSLQPPGEAPSAAPLPSAVEVAPVVSGRGLMGGRGWRYGLALCVALAALAGGLSLTPLADLANAQAQSEDIEGDANLPPPAMVSVAMVERSALAPRRWVSASVHSRSDARLAADVGARVLALAEVGERLRAGQPIARLDTSALALSVREQEARIGRLRVEAEQAERQWARLRQLGSAGHVSGLQLDEAEARLQGLQAQRREADVTLEQLRLQLAQAVPRAPFDGVVVERFAAVGEVSAAGAPLLRLVDTADLEVRARAPVALAASLIEGGEVVLRVEGAEHAGRLGTVVPVGDEVSRQLELRLPLSGLALPVGQALELGLPTAAAREALLVPRDAIVLRREGSHVLRVGVGEVAERVAVELGESQGERIEVRGDLNIGDRVIIRGAERLREDQRIAVLPATAASLASR